MPVGRGERAKGDKRERIMAAARQLFAERGVSGVTTQQIAGRADAAIGTLYRYAATKAELLIMVQNEKFAAAIDGLAAVKAAAGRGCARGSRRSRPSRRGVREGAGRERPHVPARARLRRPG